MFDMKLAGWEFIVRGVVVYVILLLLIRLSGKRTVGQFSPFDLMVIMLLSEAVSGSLTGGDESVQGGIILAATLLGLNVLVDLVTAHSKRAEILLEGREIMVGRNGKIFFDVLKKNRLACSVVDHALRQADVDLEEMDYAILEADGTVSIIKKKQ